MSVLGFLHRAERELRRPYGPQRCAAPGPAGRAGEPLVRIGASSPLLAAALCLSACAAGPPSDAVGHYTAQGSAARGEVPLVSLLPSAGRVVAVRRTAYANGFRQEIVLEGPRAMVGENRITVEALTTAREGGRGSAGEALKLDRPGDVEIAAEMERSLPGVTMRIAAAPERDADGPLGIATGTAGRLACVYAWQYLAPARPLSLYEGLTDTGALPMTLRVRLCGERPVAALLAELRGLRLARSETGIGEPSARPDGDALRAAVETAAPRSPSEASHPEDRPGRRRRAALAPRRTSRVAAHRRLHAIPARSWLPPRAREAASSLPHLPMPDEFPQAAAIARPEPASTPGRTVADGVLPLPR